MGHSPPAPGFGHVDLELDLDFDHPQEGVEGVPPLPSDPFGQLDFDMPVDSPRGEEQVPPSTSRVFGNPKAGPHTRATRPAMASVHDESTRIVHGDALSNITRPPPPPEPITKPPQAQDDNHTRAWTEVDDALLAASGVAPEDAPPPSRSNEAPSESGVATRDNRVAAMRELYAKGDAAGALALGATLGQTVAPPRSVRDDRDHPDASIVVEFGEEEEISDPFGGLIPLTDDRVEPAAPGAVTAAPPRLAALSVPAPHAPTPLSLTERHSIPRVLKSAGEISKLPIDHRAGFLLAHVDGMQTLEEILDVCAMPPTEALDLIGKLKKMGVIEFE